MPDTLAEAKAELQTSYEKLREGSSEERVSPLIIALSLMGIPVLDHEGAVIPVGVPSSGPPVPAWQVQMLADRSVDDVRLTLGELEGILQDTMPEGGSFPWAKTIGAAVRSNLLSGQERLVTASGALGNLGPYGDVDDKGQLFGSDAGPDTEISLHQAFALTHLVSREIHHAVKDVATGPSSAPTVQSSRAPGPCRFSKSEELIVSGGEAYLEFLSGGLVDYLEDLGALPGTASSYLWAAGLASDIAETLLTALSLNAKISVDDNPLPRTHSASKAGEETTLRASVSFDLGNKPLWNCFRLAMAAMGVSGITIPDGKASGIEAQFIGVNAFRPPVGRILQFHGSCHLADCTKIDQRVERVRANKQGMLAVKIQGLPQDDEVPQDARELEKDASVRMAVNLQEADLWKDLVSAAGTAADLSLARAVVATLRRMKIVSFTHPFKVKDWEYARYFKFTLTSEWEGGKPFIGSGGVGGGSDWYVSSGKEKTTGLISCVPPARTGGVTERWYCGAESSTSGNGSMRHYPSVDVIDCNEKWTISNAVMRTKGPSTNLYGDNVQLALDRDFPEPPFTTACGRKISPGLPNNLPLPIKLGVIDQRLVDYTGPDGSFHHTDFHIEHVGP